MRPLGEWDAIIFGAGTHRWLLLASALPVIALSAAGFASRRLRPFIGGVALGTGALLFQMAWSADVAFVGAGPRSGLGGRKRARLPVDCEGRARRPGSQKV